MENQADKLSERFLVFASNIIKLVKRIDTNQFHRHIGMQLFRSATAIGANSCSSLGFFATRYGIVRQRV
jgi:hypothetical protein